MAEGEDQADEIADLAFEIYAIHETVIEESGGLPGLRDGALLHAAAARPFATFNGNDLYPGDFDKAAALFHSLIKSHPFMDGTKRTAFLSALFLLENLGYVVSEQLPKDEVIRFCLDVAQENVLKAEGVKNPPYTIERIAFWFRSLFHVGSDET
jgi:death-on-curing protein